MLETPKSLWYYQGDNPEDDSMMDEMGNQQERRDAAVYLAAMIQGEGSVVIYKTNLKRRGRVDHTVGARIQVYNSDPLVLDEVQRYCKVLGVGEYRYTYAPQTISALSKQPIGRLYVTGWNRLSRFLPHIIPFLVGHKKKVAEQMLRLSESRRSVKRNTPYEAWQLDLVKLCPGRNRLESSQTNTPSTTPVVKIEPGPLAKASGGESVSKYPATHVAS